MKKYAVTLLSLLTLCCYGTAINMQPNPQAVLAFLPEARKDTEAAKLIDILKSKRMSEAISAKLSEQEKILWEDKTPTVEFAPETFTITISCPTPSPQFSAKLANLYAKLALLSTEQKDTAEIMAMIMELQKKLEPLDVKIKAFEKTLLGFRNANGGLSFEKSLELSAEKLSALTAEIEKEKDNPEKVKQINDELDAKKKEREALNVKSVEYKTVERNKIAAEQLYMAIADQMNKRLAEVGNMSASIKVLHYASANGSLQKN